MCSICNNFCFLNNVQKVKKELNDTTMDSLNAPVSSRGRRIVPPLSYWTGKIDDKLIK